MKDKQSLISRALKTLSLTLICFVAVAVFSERLYAQSALADFRRGEVLVEIKPATSIDAINQQYGTSTIQRIYGTNFYRLSTPKGKKENKWRKKIAKNSNVLSAALNPVITTPINVFGRAVIGFPGDRPSPGQARVTYLAQQLVGDLQAIQLRSRGAGVIVALIDTGIDRNHPDIRDHLWTDPGEVPDDNIDNDNDGLVDDVHGWNFFDATKDTLELRGDPQASVAGHGTFIAGLIALIAPEAKIMPIRAFSPDGVSDAFSVAQGIKYAVDHGARVINLSFGSTEDSPVMHDAVSYAQQRGVLLIAAVGNENKGNDVAPQFPANWNLEVMGVAALDDNNRKADFSNFGTNVSVSAPGVNLVSLYPELDNSPDYAMWSGTSFAAPLASAGAALILEGDSRRNARAAIETTTTGIDASNPGLSGKLGSGRIDPLRALQSLDPITSNHNEIALLPTGIEPTALGEAEVSITAAEQEFEVEVEQLQPRTAYKIVVNGNVIIDGANAADPNRLKATTSNFGTFKIEFSTTPSSNHLPLPAALTPVTVISLVEVLDSQNRVVLANTFGIPQPGGGGHIEKEAKLTSTGEAKGRARAEIEPEREELRVEGENLQSGVAYSISADGVSLGAVVAHSGYFRVEFTSDNSSGRLLPPSLRPVTKLQKIEVRDPTGQIILQGTFQAGGDDFGGGGDGGGGGEVEKDADLNPTGVESEAKGKVKTRVSSSRETLEIEGDKLKSSAQYQVVVDGFSLGTVTTEDNGSFKLSLSSENGTLPPQVRPVSDIRLIQVFDWQIRLVLTGGPPS
ncbi:MAG TPA: S8 family serine peptidase [Blastocatellia bacterium]|nr:S8 family serine peptidase [Blastocatellia bacterium]